MKKVFEALFGILAFLVYSLGSTFIHIYTAYLIYYNFGTFWCIIGFLSPRYF